RPGLALSGWPFRKAILDPYYARARTGCGLGRFDYEAAAWADSRRPLFPVPSELRNGIHQLGDAQVFTRARLGEVCRARNTILYTAATAVELVTDPAGESVAHLRV